MTIHVVVGPPCSGKSTFVDDKAPPGVPRFDFDRVSGVVANMDLNHEKPPAVLDTVLAMRRGLMGYALDPETVVEELWIINANPSESTIQRLVQAGAKFHLIDPGEAECIARAERDGRPPGTVDRIKQWYQAPPALPEEKGGGSMKHKDLRVKVKADGDDGQFTAYASTFDVKDSYGDVIRKGAFADTLTEWKDSGNILPVLYGHDFSDPFSNIGAVVEAVEDDHGLKITAQLDLDNAKAAQVYKLLKQKRLTQMSFAFDVVEGAFVDEQDDSFYELRKVKLYEVSVVPIGANQETEILAVKQASLAAAKAVEDHNLALVKALEENNSELSKALAGLHATASGLAKALGDLADKLNEEEENPDGDKPPGSSDEEAKSINPGEVKAALAHLLILEREK